MPRRKVIRSPRHARREREKKTRKVLLLSLLVFVIFGLALYGLSRPEFRIKDIEISGASRVSEALVAESVKQGMGGYYLGFISKSHTLLYPKSLLNESLLREFPTFSAVSISLRSLSAIRVAVREREPVALWCGESFGCYLVDETGFAFAEGDLEMHEQYYLLEGLSTSSPLGTQVISAPRLKGAISFLSQLEKLAFNPVKVVFKSEDELEAIIGKGTRLLVRDEDIARALLNLETLLGEAGVFPGERGALGVEYIDLRYGNKIYFKPR